MKASLYGGWYCIPQRPHHLASVLINAGWNVNVFTTYGIRSAKPNIRFTPNINKKILLPNQLSRLSFFKKFIPSINKNLERKVFKEFVESKANLFIHYREPWQESTRISNQITNFIYDCVDNWGGFKEAHPKLQHWETSLCERADQIWVVSRHLEEKLSRWASKLWYVPNGVDYDHFSHVRQIRAKRKTNSKLQLIYIGAIFNWFDAYLVGEVAKRLKNWDLILIGPCSMPSDQSKFLNHPNIKFLGRREYYELPELLANAQVAIIPFIINDLISGTSPIKFYEYLAAGLPVVATPIPEIVPYIEQGVVACTDKPTEFANLVEELASSSNPDRCQKIAKQSAWEARFLPLLKPFEKK